MRGHPTPWGFPSFAAASPGPSHRAACVHYLVLSLSFRIHRRNISSATLAPCVPSSTFRPRIVFFKSVTTLGGHGLSVSTETDTDTNLNVDDLSAGRICEYPSLCVPCTLHHQLRLQ